MEEFQRPLTLAPLLDAAPFPETLMPRLKSASDEAAVRKRVHPSLVPPLPGFPASITVASFEAESKVDSVELPSGFGSDTVDYGTLDETGRSTNTKSALYRRFLAEIRSRAVHAPGRRDSAASGLPRVMPRPGSDYLASHTSVSATGRRRPASAAAGISQSRIASSASARLSAIEVHHAPPVLYNDGVKHGCFVTLQAQFDKLRHGGVSTSRSALPGNSAATVPTNLRKVAHSHRLRSQLLSLIYVYLF